jgi:hypothetical protein
VVDAIGPDGMSGEETDDGYSGREKGLVRVPVRWVNPQLMELCHAVDTWRFSINEESFSTPRGNRPLPQLPKSKEPEVGKVTKGLPRNWYDDTWYKSQSDPKKLQLKTAPPRPIPSLVSSICFLFA